MRPAAYQRPPVYRGEESPHWKGDAASDDCKRVRCQKMFPLRDCEHCGAPGVERHHKDANPGNNTPENVEILCRKCHMRADGRTARAVARLNAYVKQERPRAPCVTCGKPAGTQGRKRCHTCAEYLRITGRERSAKLIARLQRRKRRTAP